MTFSRLALLAFLVAACGPVTDPVTPPPPPPLTGAGPFLVSNAVVNGVQGNTPGGSPTAGATTYISLPPGSLPEGTAVHIRVERTSVVVSAALVDGGLDPVAVPAVAGDTITLTVEQSDGTTSEFRVTLAIRKPPVIVRTQPEKNKRDVPLNIRIQVVFSEPIDPASLTPQSFALRSGGNSVAGELSFANAAFTVVEFTPAADLSAATDYELVLQAGIRDTEGSPLGVAERIPFNTTSVPPTPVGFGSVTGMILGIGVNGAGYTYPVFIRAVGPRQSPGYWAATSSSFTFQGLAAGEWTLAFTSIYPGGYPNIRLYQDTAISVTVLPNQTVTVPEMALRPVAPSILAILVETCPWGFSQTPTLEDWGNCDSGYWGGVDVAVEVQGVAGTATAGVHYSLSIPKEDWKFELYGVPTGEYDVSVTPRESRWLLLPWQSPSRRLRVDLGVTMSEFDYWYQR